KSEEQSIADYIQEFRDTTFQHISIKDLLLMRSDIYYEEGKLWFSDDTKTYYLPDLRDLAINNIRINKKYDGCFHYNNYHPLLLGIILERSTGVSVSAYLEEKIWSKLGMEYDATWSIDSFESNFEKMESGLNFRSIDFAKIGSMILHNGKWDEEDIVSDDWLKRSTIAEFPLKSEDYHGTFLENKNTAYKYMWYSLRNEKGGIDFYAAGKYGQYLYISPLNNTVIVRNGYSYGSVDWWPSVLAETADFLGDF
ncbi:MAG: serine hydrolase domain-containing protein, partial [Halanaerobiales bacterium]